MFAQGCAVSRPENLLITDKRPCQAILHWNSVTSAGYYLVRYRLTVDTDWIAVADAVYDTLFTFSGLQPATAYEFAVSSACTEVIKSRYQIVADTTTSCEIPGITSVEVVNNTTSITWQTDCDCSANRLRYKDVDSADWINIFTGTIPSFTIDSLSWNTNYVFQVNACFDTVSYWSPLDTFSIAPRPNILLIVLDDARFNSFGVTGGPSFFQSTSIDRIAHEGANFTATYVTYALCAPSRATMFTGLYPHKNGGYNNQTTYDTSLPTIGTILHNEGYYTAMLGKFLMPALPNDPQPGWDFWMASDKWNKIDPTYNYNGTIIKPKGHEVDVITDSAIHLFSAKSDSQPLLLLWCTLTPHMDYEPRPQDVGMYANEQMPLPDNFFKYQDNYPSFYYTAIDSDYQDSAALVTDEEAYYESLYGADVNVGRLLDTLEKMNILDNTVVIFTSDNGFFHGEHQFEGKKLSLEPAIHVPLLVRYPAWFAQDTVIDDQLATNLDLAPTILDAAGITNTFGMDGYSLREIYNGSKQRKEMYIELLKSDVDGYANLRSIRTFQYKFNSYFCSDTTEEFFDLINDPLEDTNLINEPAYQSLIDEYRYKLDSLKTFFKDTITEVITDCYLVQNERQGGEVVESAGNTLIYPNPASTSISIVLDHISDPVGITISSIDGKIINYRNLHSYPEGRLLQLDIGQLPEGLYFVEISYAADSEVRKLVIIH